MQIISNQQPGNANGPCNSASCGGRTGGTGGTTRECVNADSNAATRSGDYLQIEGAFSIVTVPHLGLAVGGWWG